MSFIKHYILIVFFLSVISPAVGHAGGLVNTGGEPRYFMLNMARGIIVKTLARILEDMASHPEDTSKALRQSCRDNTGLNPEQAAICADFIVSVASKIIACNQSEGPFQFAILTPGTDEYKKYFSNIDYLFVRGQRVTAATVAVDCKIDSMIRFDYENLRDLRTDAIFITLMHEFGHKVPYNGKYSPDIGSPDSEIILDTQTFAGLAGSDLLNAAAGAVYGYSDRLGVLERSIWSQSERIASFEYEKRKHFFKCDLSHGDDAVKTFQFYNDVSRRQQSDQYHSQNNEDDVRGVDITPMTRSFAPDRHYFLALEIHGDFQCQSQIPRTSTLMMLGSDFPGLPDPLRAKRKMRNMICDKKPFALVYKEGSSEDTTREEDDAENGVALNLENDAMKIQCRYEGFYSI